MIHRVCLKLLKNGAALASTSYLRIPALLLFNERNGVKQKIFRIFTIIAALFLSYLVKVVKYKVDKYKTET